MLAWLFLILGTVGTSALAVDVDLLLPPSPTVPSPLESPKPTDQPGATPDTGAVSPRTPVALAPGDATPAAAVDLDRVVRDTLDRIRFENFSPPPPGASPDTRSARDHDASCAAVAVFGRGGGRSLVSWVYGEASGYLLPDGVDNEVSALERALSDPESALATAVRAALAGPFTLRRLNELIEAATAAAQTDGGWSLARAFAPEQELTGGTLRIVVAPVWLEAVTVSGTRWSDPEALRRPYAAFIGDPVRMRALELAYADINRHPFRRVSTALSPGSAPGTSRLELTARERKPWTAFAGYETTHSRDSGIGRYHAGFTVVAPWRTEDLWTAQYAVDSDFGHLDSASTVYRSALPWGHTLTATALWSRSSSLSGGVVDQDSTDWLARLAYGVPLPSLHGWTHELEAGLEWRRTESTSRFGGVKFHENVLAAAPLSLGWRGQRPDRWGAWGLSVDAVAGVDWPLAEVTREAYRKQREGATPNWLALWGSATRDWLLPADFRMRQRLWGQWSPDRLTDAGQFNLGGSRSVRGYRESEVSGDGGLGFSLETFTPSLIRFPPPEKPAGEEGAVDALRPWRPLGMRLAAFYDAGLVYRSGSRLDWEKATTGLSGAGLGLLVEYTPWISVRADYAWRLHDTDVAADDHTRGYGYLTVNVAF